MIFCLYRMRDDFEDPKLDKMRAYVRKKVSRNVSKQSIHRVYSSTARR